VASDVLAQVDLEAEIVRLCDRQEKAQVALAGLSKKAAEAEADYRKARAAALVRLKMDASPRVPVAVLEAHADLEAHDAYVARRLRESDRDVTQEALRSCRSQLSALQTLAANQRALVVGS